jgi:hypothetical protein
LATAENGRKPWERGAEITMAAAGRGRALEWNRIQWAGLVRRRAAALERTKAGRFGSAHENRTANTADSLHGRLLNPKTASEVFKPCLNWYRLPVVVGDTG